MAAYADYSYYRDDYRGQMGEDDFARLSIRASAYLDAATFRRIRGAWTEDAAVRDACCAVADACLLYTSFWSRKTCSRNTWILPLRI